MAAIYQRTQHHITLELDLSDGVDGIFLSGSIAALAQRIPISDMSGAGCTYGLAA